MNDQIAALGGSAEQHASMPGRVGDGMRDPLPRLSDLAGQLARVAAYLGRTAITA